MSDLKREFEDLEGASNERLLIAARPFARYSNRLPDRCVRARAELARRLRAARRALGTSQADVAREVGVSPNHYSQAERGTSCPSEALARIVRQLLGDRKESAA